MPSSSKPSTRLVPFAALHVFQLIVVAFLSRLVTPGQVTNDYNQALRSISTLEHEQRSTYLQLHAQYAALWPAATALRDCPRIGIPAIKEFDIALPATREEDVIELSEALQQTDADYAIWLQSLPPLPTFNRAAFQAHSLAHSSRTVTGGKMEAESRDNPHVVELEAQVARLQVEVLALHAECYMLANPAATDRRLAHCIATEQALAHPSPLDVSLPPAMTASMLSPIPEQGSEYASDEVEQSVSASEAGSGQELERYKQELDRSQQENAELQAQLATLQLACDGLQVSGSSRFAKHADLVTDCLMQEQLEQVDLQQAEQDLEQSRVGRAAPTLEVRRRLDCSLCAGPCLT